MVETTKKRLVLLDSHAILHRAYHALPDFSSSKGEPTGALYGLASMLIKIISDLKPDYLVATFDLPKPTYRHEAYKEYKAGRAKAEPELIAQIKRSRDIFEAFSVPMYDKEGFEADDILGTIVEKVEKGIGYRVEGIENKKNSGTTKPYTLTPEPFFLDIIIASGDMDTLQLVDDKKVQVYTLKKGINDTILYDEEAVIKRFGFGPKLLPDYKGLRGDPSDNIIGIKGIGEKTGGILVNKFGAIENMYTKIKKSDKDFKSAGISERIIGILKENEEEALFSKMLATIRRDAPIDFVLPEKSWRETIDIDRVNKLFAELEFRTLGARLANVLQGKVPAPVAGAGIGISNKQQSLSIGGNNGSETEKIAVDLSVSLQNKNYELQTGFKETALALWLVNSNITNPKSDDILNWSGAKTFEEASTAIFKRLGELGLVSVFENIEKPLLPIVERMKDRGIGINKDHLAKLSKDYHKVLAELEKKIWTEAGEEFNISSPKQLGAILFGKLGLKAKNQKKTGTGALSTKESEIEKLREAHPIIGKILEYRELSKLLGTYIDTIPDMVGEDGRLHAEFLQAGTTTGRMASENPNLQNIPNKTELGRNIRYAFVPAKGFQFVAFDYSQIELRIAAFLSGDEKLIEIFRRGEDVHTAVAAEVFGLANEEVTPDMRRKAKVINFGVMYGMGVNALRANLGAGTTREESQKFYNEYFAKFSGLAIYLEKVKADARRLGYTETFFGRRRYFPGITSKLPFIRAGAERQAANAPIQGTEADIIKLAMIEADKFIEKSGIRDKAYLLLQVHDELVYEVENSLVPKFIATVKPIMESVIDPGKIKGVVCTVEAKAGDNWGEMKKVEL